jgi:circadian clock protein KaiC
MTFFDETAIPERIYYVSAFRTLEEEGLEGLVDLLRREIRGHDASVLILDGLVAAEETATSDREFKKFIHEVQSHAAAAGCTVFLLTSGRTPAVAPEHTMVDGLIELEDRLTEMRTERSLQVRKFRGSATLRGRHSFRITIDGIRVFRRLEVALALPTRPSTRPEGSVSSGVASLDALLPGGLPLASTTAVMGPTGAGKTTLGLQFLAPSTLDEPGLFFGLYETPDRLRAKARAIGFDLGAKEERGEVRILWYPQGENLLDELGHRILECVWRGGVKRLVIDGFGGFIESAVDSSRISRFFSVLANELRANGVTTMCTLETRELVGPVLQMPITGFSSIIENLIVMRYVEVRGRLQPLVSIAKVRDGAFDPALHVFRITSAGVQVGEPLEGYESILTGLAHETGEHASRRGGRPRRRAPEE